MTEGTAALARCNDRDMLKEGLRLRLGFDFTRAHGQACISGGRLCSKNQAVSAENILRAVEENCVRMLYSGRTGAGTGGIARFGAEVQKWKKCDKDAMRRLCAQNAAVILGRGGGLLRTSYAEFLLAADEYLQSSFLYRYARAYAALGREWDSVGCLLRRAADTGRSSELADAGAKLREISLHEGAVLLPLEEEIRF